MNTCIFRFGDAIKLTRELSVDRALPFRDARGPRGRTFRDSFVVVVGGGARARA